MRDRMGWLQACMGMSAAKTGAQRIKELRQRRKAGGLKELRGIWAHPDDEQRIRSYGQKLARKRDRTS